jgi:hypothetical protein
MQRVGYTKDPSAQSSSELKAFDKIFDSNLTAFTAEALEDSGNGSSSSREGARPPSGSHPYVGLVVFHFCNIETRGLLLGWSNYDCFRSTFFGVQ